MELVYIRMSKYGNIDEKFEMNFTSKYQFKYDKESQQLEYVEYPRIKDFFCINKDENKINDIIAIVGKNGVGKSTIINYLKNHIFYCFSQLNPGEIVIFKKDEEFVIYQNIEIKNIQDGNLKINDIEVKCENIKKEKVNEDQKSRSLAIFYSNVFDYPELGDNGSEYVDITTNFLILNHFKTYLEVEGVNYNSNTFNYNLNNAPIIYKHMEIQNEIKFLINKKNVFPFSIKIDKLGFTINSRYINMANDDVIMSYLKKYRDDEIQNKWHNIIDKMSNLEKSLFYAFMREYKELYMNNNDVEAIFNKIVDNEYINKIKKGIELFEIMHLLSKKISHTQGIQQALEDIKVIITEFEKYENATGQYYIDINVAIKYIEIINRSFRITQPLFIDWKLSSGEKALLSMYSRFYNILDNDKIKKYRGDTINIFIDECDVYLHPEWQRKYINNLIYMVNSIFKEYKFKANIILTTHSPIILSDLPDRNVKLLDIENDKTVIKNNLDNNLTFGSNINELYAEKFFLDKCLIGEFAKKKIEHLFNEILNENTEYIEEHYEVYNQRISVIGEPIIRERMYEELRVRILESRNKNKYLSSEISRLEKEIARIKDMQEDLNK